MKLAHVDAIRGVAILMVIMVHAAQSYDLVGNAFDLLARYGQMGVQLFFVASAYTLCLSADRRGDESRPLLKYAIRRFFRIAPLYYVGIGVYYVVAQQAWFADNHHVASVSAYTPLNVLANVFFVHGFHAPANNVIVPGGWSIGTEMAFYAVFPFLFAFAKTCFSESGAGRTVWVMVALSFSQIALLLLYPLGLRVENGGFMYFNLVTQAPVFFVGMAYYYYDQRRTREYAVGYDVLGFVVLTGLALGLWSLYIGHLYSLIPVISALSFLFLIEVFRKVTWLNVAVLQRLGRVSYSVYIVHFAVVWSLSKWWAAGLAGVVGGVGSVLVVFAAATVLSYGVAKLTERAIERPAMALGKRLVYGLDRRVATEVGTSVVA